MERPPGNQGSGLNTFCAHLGRPGAGTGPLCGASTQLAGGCHAPGAVLASERPEVQVHPAQPGERGLQERGPTYMVVQDSERRRGGEPVLRYTFLLLLFYPHREGERRGKRWGRREEITG